MSIEVFSLKGKTALVTGGSRGIGAAICESLAEAGADVAVVSRKVEKCELVAEKVRSKGARAIAVGAHVGKAEDCQRAVEATIQEFGGIDILVNNAATNPVFGPSADCSDDAFDKIFAVNVKGPFMLTKLVLPHMEKRGGGAIVNVVSVAGLVPAPMIGVYSMSKAALIHQTKTFAKELGVYGVRVNAVAPGLVKTDFSRALWEAEEMIKEFLGKQPIQKLAEPRDICGAVVFLASPASAMMTGSIVVVDGGQLTG
jgi:NAD(P)-dependent dehydrogenase (short-subunit alcohol dehydrogenase family)